MAQKNDVSNVHMTKEMLHDLERVAVAEGLENNVLWMMCRD